MKTNFWTECLAAIAVVAASGLLAGCMENDVYNPDRGKTELKPESEYFDFNTTSRVAFDVDYGTLANGALLEVYTEDPLTFHEDGTYTVSGEAAYKIFTDNDGRFTGKVELPKSAERVFIISRNWGAPLYVAAEVTDGKVTVDETSQDKAATTRVVANPQVHKQKDGIYSIVEWAKAHGKINDKNQIVSTGSFGSNDIKQLQQTLWKGKTTKPEGLDNSALVTDTKHVNTTIARAYTNSEGESVTVQDAELHFTFLSESCWYLNTIGYYYYKTDEVPDTPDDVEKFIIIPNASISGNYPYTKNQWSWGSGEYKKTDAPIANNTRIQLLYKDEQGNVSTKFPAGYTVGYFIIPDGYQPNSGIDYGKGFVYSNKEWNDKYNGEQARFISLTASNGTVVYGVEDGGDKSYEDVLFCIDANPNEAIQDPDRPVIDPEKPTISSVETTCCTYAYEDIWPNGGDYDLNDVIIEHKRIVTFNEENYVQRVEEQFVPVQRNDAATYVDAFAVQYAADQRGEISLPEGAVDETETSSVILFPDAMGVIGRTFTVVRSFAEGALKKTDLATDLNPFVIAQYVAGADNRMEIHLPKKKATGKADATQIGNEDDAYYIHKDGKYPFAIMLPLPTAADTPVHFTPATEKMSIDKDYPDFAKWVESNGTTHNDWYLHRQTGE